VWRRAGLRLEREARAAAQPRNLGERRAVEIRVDARWRQSHERLAVPA